MPRRLIAGRHIAIERKEGVDTHPARRFLYLKQPSFDVLIEGEPIHFRSHVVRAAVAEPERLAVEMERVGRRGESDVVHGLVRSVTGQAVNGRLQVGGTYGFKFVGLEGWQRLLLEAAQWLQLPVCIAAVETISTCTLRQLPADVHQVPNWRELLRGACAALRALRDALNDNECPEDRKAA